MRIKYLLAIAGLFAMTFVVTSCLNSKNDYEYSSDDLITAFELDTIYGVKYKFTINQLAGEVVKDGVTIKIGEIFNEDSVAFSADTIINKILIKKITTNGLLTAGNGALSADTLFSYAKDSLNLLNTVNKPLVLRVRSYDGQSIREYHIKVRIHKSDPDSLVWGGMEQKAQTESFSGGNVLANQETKAVVQGKSILLFSSHSDMYSSNVNDGVNWAYTNTVNLPEGVNLASILNFKGNLYAATGSGDVYKSLNGVSWDKIPSVIVDETNSETASAVTLITTFSNDDNTTDLYMAGIIKQGDDYRFATAVLDAQGGLLWTKGGKVPEEFPLHNTSATKSYRTNTGMQMAVMTGKPYSSAVTKTIPWFSNDGLSWGALSTTDKYSIPLMKSPSVIYYGKTLYIFGDDFLTFYTSPTGLTWEKTTKKFLLPKNKISGKGLFEGRSGYSAVVDDSNHLWVFFGKSLFCTDEVWKAYQNKLGFLKQ